MNRKNQTLIINLAVLFIILLASIRSEAQYNPPPAPGRYYFVSDQLETTAQFYWREPQNFGGIKTIPNYNLLAAVLGDSPAALLQSGQQLVAPESYNFGGGAVSIQPFAFTAPGSTKKLNLPAGSNLAQFLSNPLAGARFDLSMPFSNPSVALSDRSAIMRGGTDSGVWHIAVDLDVNGNTSQGFDVIAPADGIVEGTSPASTSLAIRHSASNGRQFLTIYQHMVPQSKAHLTIGTAVRRGQVLGHVQDQGYTHLHFGLAVRGPSRMVNGATVPEMWYLLDPFGVYDYRRNSASATAYNYLPANTLLAPTRGVIHMYAWRTDPPIGSLLTPEDCVPFNPDKLAIQTNGTQRVIVDGSHLLFSFPNQQEADTALKMILHYRVNKSCFVGRPNPPFKYLLANNQSPAGATNGEDCLAFDPRALRLEALNDGRYRMAFGSQSMFLFPDMLRAGNALSMIRKYGFSYSCFVGRPNPSMQYMRR